MWILLLLLFSVVQCLPCPASFPKGFGGTKSQSNLNQLAFQNDLLAAVGTSKDSDLTGLAQQNPVVILFRGPAMIQAWSKSVSVANSLGKLVDRFHSATFSPDSTILAYHMGSPLIVFFRTCDGSVIGSQVYTTATDASSNPSADKFKSRNMVFSTDLVLFAAYPQKTSGFYIHALSVLPPASAPLWRAQTSSAGTIYSYVNALSLSTSALYSVGASPTSASTLLISRLDPATGVAAWTHSFTGTPNQAKVVLATLTTLGTDYVFVAGLFAATTFLRLTVSGTGVTASE